MISCVPVYTYFLLYFVSFKVYLSTILGQGFMSTLQYLDVTNPGADKIYSGISHGQGHHGARLVTFGHVYDCHLSRYELF